MASNTKPNKRRVLIIRIDGIGDIVLFSPFLKSYRKLYPDWQIDLLLTDSAISLIPKNGYVDRVIPFSRKKFKRLWYRAILLYKLRAQKYDLVIYPPYTRHPDGDYILQGINARECIGFVDTEDDKVSFTKKIIADSELKHEVERNREFLEKLGLSIPQGTELAYPFPTAEDTEATKHITHLIPKTKSWVIFGIGAGHPSRKWPLEHFISLGKKLLTIGAALLIIGSREDETAAHELKKELGDNVFLLLNLPLSHAAAIMRGSRVFVGNDSGPKHLAAAVGVPVVEISTYPERDKAGHKNSIKRFGAWRVKTVQLTPNKKMGVHEIRPEEVWQTLRPFLESANHASPPFSKSETAL